jgi:HEPN superfamily RiboL-PSP-like protein
VNVESFANGLHRGLARRKFELTHVRVKTLEYESDDRLDNWVTRTAVLLSYAHWEGFIKESSTRYLRLINSKSVRVNQLKSPLQAACLSSHFKRARGSEKASYLGSILAEMDGRRCEIFNVTPEKIVDTESNLSSVAFRDLVLGLGLEYIDAYETRQAFVDEALLRSRNQVAHGELASFTIADATERIDGVLSLLDLYSNQLIDAARDSSFLLEVF